MAEPKTIYCPKCGRRVLTWDGKATIDIAVNCKKCWKRIVFHPSNQLVEIKDIPRRNKSSGKRFY